MTKRRLTKQQHQRITSTQAKRREQLQTEVSEGHLSAPQEGLLVAHFGVAAEIEDHQEQIYRCALRQNLPPLVVGDRVVWRQGHAGMGVVTSMHPRETELVRYNSHGQKKIIAANLNQVVVMSAVYPEFSETLLDSYLAAITLSNLQPIIVLNKIDLLEADALQAMKQRLAMYEKIGYAIYFMSCEKEIGIKAIVDILNDKISVFVGQSGVGKSSLIQKFVDDQSIAVAEISEKHKMGKHTTTTSRLYHLENGSLIDSPGVREFGLGKITPKQLFDSFIDFKPYKGLCKFRNCQHLHEPECALKTAVDKNEIFESRFQNFRKLLENL